MTEPYTRTESGTDTASRINDHLPECMCSIRQYRCMEDTDCVCYDCICKELRACEQRVRIESQAWHYKQGRSDALDAAEAAVEAIDRFDWIPPTYAKTKVVAAIRALKEAK